jgi:arginyl-tRNA synthetase
LLQRKVKLAQETLGDGTVIEADSFEKGSDIYLVDGENKTPLALGTYTLANGTVITVSEVGKIGEVVTAETEVEVEVEAEDKPVEEPTDSPLVEKEEKEMAEVPATLEEILTAVVDAIQPKLDDLQAKIDALSGTQTEMKATLSSAVVSKSTTHKPSNGKVDLSKVNVATNVSSTEARIMALLS